MCQDIYLDQASCNAGPYECHMNENRSHGLLASEPMKLLRSFFTVEDVSIVLGSSNCKLERRYLILYTWPELAAFGGSPISHPSTVAILKDARM